MWEGGGVRGEGGGVSCQHLQVMAQTLSIKSLTDLLARGLSRTAVRGRQLRLEIRKTENGAALISLWEASEYT